MSVTDDNMLEVAGETNTSTGITHSIRWNSRIPRDVDTDRITGTVQDGIISLTLPKKEKAAPLQIALCTTSHEEVESESDDDDSSYALTLPVPGLAAADVELTVSDGVLRIHGETKRTGARVAKTMRLPRDADPTGAHASHIDGLLTLTLPKRAPEVKTIAVRMGEERTSTALDEEGSPTCDDDEDAEMV